MLIDELRAHKGTQLAELYLHGKLLYAAVTAKIAQQRWPGAARKMDAPRQITDWRLWVFITDELKAGFKTCFVPRTRFAKDFLKSVAERPRQRQLQSLPAAAHTLIGKCRKLGVSHV